MSDTRVPVGLENEFRTVRAVTHSGSFHPDDVFAMAILSRALAVVGGPWNDYALENAVNRTGRLELTRTRDPRLIAAADIVFDVGAVFDPAQGRYDHHMLDRPLREDGTPFSSAGLLWRDYGRAAVRNMLPGGGEPELVDAVWEAIDGSIILPIDRLDNGIGKTDALHIAYDIDGYVDAYNLPWDFGGSSMDAVTLKTYEDSRFADAWRSADLQLRRSVDQARARHMAFTEVLRCHAGSVDPRVLELDIGLPWQGAVFDAGLPVLYAVYPAGTDKWMVGAMPPEPGSFAQRLPLPEGWRGLRDGELAAVCGVPDAIFVHPNRFICGATSREGALEMARRAVAIGIEPGQPRPR